MKELNRFMDHNKVLIIIYSLWVVVHIICLSISTGVKEENFYPFDTDPDMIIDSGNQIPGHVLKYSYDISEFTVYTLIPLIFIFIYWLITKNSNSKI